MHSSCQPKRILLLTLAIAYIAVAIIFVSRWKTGSRARKARKGYVQFARVLEQSLPQSLSVKPLTSNTRTVVESIQGNKDELRNQVLPEPRVPHGTPKNSEAMDRDSKDSLRLYTDDPKYGTAMCRFSRACVSTNGALLLPNSLERFRPTIAKECNIENNRLSFYNPDSDSRMLDSALTKHHQAKHLAGLHTLRFHMPHLVSDLLKYTLVLFPYLQQLSNHLQKEETSSPFPSQSTTVSCYEPDASSSGAREYACDANPPQLSSVLVEKRGRSIGWVPGIFHLLQKPTSAAPLEALYTDEAFPVGESAMKMRANKTKLRNACFASISVAGKARKSITPQNLHEGLLTQPAIVRDIEEIPKHLPCRINATIINRPVVRQIKTYLSTESRRVVNTDSVRKALLAEAHRLNISIIVSERTDFHKISFQHQFKVMQETHSLISVHGAELTNLVFLRRKSTLVEIYPFRYRPGIFEGLANLVGLGHEAVIAKPDVEGYRKCMLSLFPPDRPNHKEAKLSVMQFEDAATTFLAATSSEGQASVGNHFDGNATAVGSAARVCARSQRLVVSDPKHVAREALKNVKQQCYGDLRPGTESRNFQ